MKLYSIIGAHAWFVGHENLFRNEEVFTFLEEFEDDAAADAWCVENSTPMPEAWGNESWLYRRWSTETGVYVELPDGTTSGPIYPEGSLEARYIDQLTWPLHLAAEARVRGLS